MKTLLTLILVVLIGCSKEPEQNIEPALTCEQKFQEIYKFGEFINDLRYIGVVETELQLHLSSVPEFINKKDIINFVYAAPPKHYQTGEVGTILVQRAREQQVCKE